MSGIITIDHRGTDWIDGSKGELYELDTEACVHCGAVIALLRRPKETVSLSQTDLGLAFKPGMSGELPQKYVHHVRCPSCRENVCRACAMAMEQTKKCPGPLKARIEAMLTEREHRRAAGL